MRSGARRAPGLKSAPRIPTRTRWGRVCDFESPWPCFYPSQSPSGLSGSERPESTQTPPGQGLSLHDARAASEQPRLGGPRLPIFRPTVYTSEGSREALGLRDCGSGRRDQREHCASSQLYREDAARGRAGAETPGRRPARSRAQGSRASLRGVQACRPGPRGVWHTRPCAQPQRPRVSLQFPHMRIPDEVTGHVADLQTSPRAWGLG